jgi:hypothetical protein
MRPTVDLSFLRDPRTRWRIAAITFAFAVGAGLVGYLSPKWYQSTVTVVPARSQKAGGVLGLLGGDLGALAGSVDSSLGGGADTARIAAVLQGTAVSDAVIEKFDLRARYGMKVLEDARDTLWKHCSVRTQPKANLVQLACEDRDPAFVRDLVAYFASYGNEVFRRVNYSSASEEARYLEKRVVELQQQADEAATRMREFQEKHKIVDLDSQARAVVSSVAALHTQRGRWCRRWPLSIPSASPSRWNSSTSAASPPPTRRGPASSSRSSPSWTRTCATWRSHVPRPGPGGPPVVPPRSSGRRCSRRR